MASSVGFHENEALLTAETKDRHRALASLQEELEAIDWYDQRVDATGDPELKVMSDINEDTLRRLGRPQRTRRMLRVDPQTRSQGFRISGNFTKGT